MKNSKLYKVYAEQRKVSTDTRKVDDDDIFFALRGPNFDGNKFAEQALAEGASYAVVDDPNIEHQQFIHVENVLKSLQLLAKQIRSEMDLPVIGITGSNGKTTTKELIREVLSRKFRTYATSGNLNNHIGVPVTILNMPVDTEIAIIEMGANHLGEIKELCSVSQPDFGLITNIGKAHLEGFGGLEGVKAGKKELYDSVKERGGQIFVNGNDPLLVEISSEEDRLLYGDSADHMFTIQLREEFPVVSFDWQTNGEKFEHIPTYLTGRYNLQNISAAIAVGLYFKVSPKDISTAISSYHPMNSRSQLLQTTDNIILLDAYNANPTSMELALKNLKGIHAEKKFFIIGDMLELGPTTAEEHQRKVDLALELNLDGFLVGNFFSELNSIPFRTFKSNLDVKKHLEEHPLKGYTMLLKGSRGIRLENLVDAL